MDHQANKSPRLRDWWAHRRLDLSALTIIFLFFLLAFGSYLVRRQFLIGGDVFFYTHPLRTMAWQTIRSGSLPLWTSSVMSGFPLLAMSQLGLAYPLTWGHLLLPSHVAEQIYVLLPFILAPSFTYSYLREIDRSWMAALIGSLSFGYGGLMTNTYGMNAIPTNALMWLPLLLIAVERSRRQPPIPCLIAASLVAALSLLTGHAASTLQLTVIVLAYSLVCSFGDVDRGWRRCQPFLVGAFSFLFAAGIASFEILETMRAVRRSIRDALTYEFFVAGSITPIEFLRSFLVPLNHYTEVTAYQAPLIVVLALIGVIKARTFDRRVLFWAAVCTVGALMMLGRYGLLYSLLYHVPLVNLFRRPTRYAFEFTFGISVLAAFGYDSIIRILNRRTQNQVTFNLITALGLASCLVVALLWSSAVIHGANDAKYLVWKLAFTGVTTAVFIFCVYITHSKSLVAILLLLICFVEPFILIRSWWPGTAKSAARLRVPSLTTSWLQKFQPVNGRVFVRTNGPEEETRNEPRFDALDRTALSGLQNTAGYEPLFPERYSRALGGVSFDGVSPRSGFQATDELFETQSHVLDLLNTRFVVDWADAFTMDQTRFVDRSGVHYSVADIGKELRPQESVTLNGDGMTADSLALVTSLANSTGLAQGNEVVRVEIFTSDARVVSLSMRAGLDTAEWAHERPDVRTNIRHTLAAVFDQTSADPSNSFNALRYETRLSFGEAMHVSHIVLTNTTQTASLALWKTTLFDSHALQSKLLTVNHLDPGRWESKVEFDGVVILQNKRCLPRAWLTHEAKAIEGEVALQLIQGRGREKFDPQKTALLEVNSNELPQLPSATEVTGDTVKVTSYEPNQIVIETSSTANSVLVVSERFYPGWQARVDGEPTRILLTDYLLRGVALPAGDHQIVMRYEAPAAKTGAIVSIVTFGILSVMMLYSRRSR